MRVVSLLPSATEIVYALGIEPVATSHECDHPPEAADLPSVVESRVDATASSGEIDEQVQTAESSGGVYAIDREALAAADPDLVISQGICEVCAVDTVVVEDAIAELGVDCELLTTDPHSLGDVLADIRRIGAATGREEAATDLIERLRGRIDRVRARVDGTETHPSVAILDWLDPVMVAGHWVPELVEIAGGSYGLSDSGDASRPRRFEEIRAYDPDVLVAAPCGFELEQTVENLTDLTDRPGFEGLAAVESRRVYAVDGHHLLNRPGPRLVDSLETLAGLFHPELFETPEEAFARPVLERPA